MTHKWNYLPITSDQAEASQRLAQELGISPVLGELLVERGITTAAAARNYRICTTRSS
jgi:single-stranded-DNA-specific exonuclease